MTETSQPTSQPAPQIEKPTIVFQITSQSESERLWDHTFFGIGVLVGMVEGYVNFKMPGVPVKTIKSLIVRLQNILNKIEAKNEV